MNISNPLIEESLFDSTNKEDGKEIYAKDCHILPICKSYGQASYCCLAGAFVGKRCSYAKKNANRYRKRRESKCNYQISKT